VIQDFYTCRQSEAVPTVAFIARRIPFVQGKSQGRRI
jgi:hypothetical protein